MGSRPRSSGQGADVKPDQLDAAILAAKDRQIEIMADLISAWKIIDAIQEKLNEEIRIISSLEAERACHRAAK
jgi:hypothetical protein